MTINALNIIPVRTASCSVMGDYAIKKKANVPWGKKKVGDVVLYDFNRNGTSDHTGIIESINADGTITVIEGNTSKTSNDNGGNVMRRTRYKSQVNYLVRPKYDKKVTPQMILAVARSQIGTKESPKNSNNVIYNTWYYGHAVSGDAYPWCMTFVEWCFAHVFQKMKKPTGKYAGIIPKPTVKYGSKGTGAKQLQQFLTWYGIKTDADGEIGNGSVSSLMQFQFNEGLEVDGVFGKKSYKRALSYTKTNTKAPVSTPQKTSGSNSKQTGKCIDVSYWQGKISKTNWEKVKKTCEYAICRASYTSQDEFKLNADSTFATNFTNAQAAGLKVGAYHYSQATSVDEAKKEAEYICNILKKYKPDFYVVCDFEYGKRLNSKIGKKASDIANAFCDVVKAHGYEPCIYANTSTLNTNLTAPKYPVWVAQYANKCTYKGDKVMWQYTSSGKVDGIDGKVDLSYVYVEAKHSYRIEVDLTNQICTVYDNGKPIKCEFVSTAKKGSTTPVGSFKIQGASGGRKAKARTAKMSSGTSYAEFLVRFYGGKCMHTVPWKERQTTGHVYKDEFNKLGSVASAGCVRMPWILAKFIYENCPLGTPVKVFKGEKGKFPMGKPKKYKATSNVDPTYKK